MLDLLRGHFVSAQAHLQSGLNILAEARSHDQNYRSGHAQPSGESIDYAISDVFSRLYAQLGLLRYPYRTLHCVSSAFQHQTPGQESPLPLGFTSYTSVWRSLDHVMNGVTHLSTKAREYPLDTEELLIHQQRINEDLDSWLTTYNNSLPILSILPSDHLPEARRDKIHRVVLAWHTMLTIMTATSIHPTNETIFDSHTSHFKQIVETLSETYRVFVADPDDSLFIPSSPHEASPCIPYTESQKPRKIGTCDMTHTITDTGWLLFFVATKCRDRILRRQGIQLLWSTDHREGFWHAKITACVAMMVVGVEEDGFYYPAGYDDADGVDYFTVMGECDYQGPVLPESCRIRDLEVRMEGDPLERILLFGGQGVVISGRVCLGVFNVREQRWV